MLLSQLRQGTIPGTAYDTAWLAQVPDPSEPGRARFPQALDWLIQNQHEDGSWGASTPYIPDRVLSTLSALAALARHGQRTSDRHALDLGIRALWRLLSVIQIDQAELAGFELLAPALIDQCQQLGVPLPARAFTFSAVGAAKLARIPEALRYSTHVSLSMSVECMGPQADIDALYRAQLKNGSLGNSPAATAFFASLTHNPAAISYLEHVQRETVSGVPFAFPIDLYEPLWVLDHLRRGGLPLNRIVPPSFWLWLSAQFGPAGISFSTYFDATDLDDTAVALILLSQAGHPAPRESLQAFERNGHYLNYAFERNPSISANIHALEALLALQAPLHELEPVVDFIATHQNEGLFWHDKWHVSPFYTTCHAIYALCGLPETLKQQQHHLIEPTLRWFSYTQWPNGSWGWLQSSVEETAYALLALLEARHAGWHVDDQIIQQGARYLEHHAAVRDYYPLWIGKCLFAPTNIIHAVVLAARYRYLMEYATSQTRAVGA